MSLQKLCKSLNDMGKFGQFLSLMEDFPLSSGRFSLGSRVLENSVSTKAALENKCFFLGSCLTNLKNKIHKAQTEGEFSGDVYSRVIGWNLETGRVAG